MELDALYRHCIFRSQERMETHALITDELSDHHLRWHGQRIDTRLYKFDTPHLSLYSLRYGAEVSIFPEPYDQFSLVHFSLSGGIEIEADRTRRQVGQGRAIVSTPDRDINLRWSENCEQLILRLPHMLLEQTARAIGQPGLYGALRRDPGLMLSDAASLQWQTQLQTFVAVEDGTRRNAALRPWLAHMEQGMAMFLLLQSARPGVEDPPADRPVHDRRRLERLEAFAAANVAQPVTLSDLARAAALSERQLNAFCHQHMGQAPMAWLRGLRLDAVRRVLLTDPGADLADLAMMHGFFHLGRFAAVYRDRFGELPSQTRRTARNG